ncbi:hypothetical protein LTR09_004060 [Extremus antarcticus]|uniref:DUF8212 domain-containing protein n=1 Tax=Extremus antarcticus TaxID=702011 RepID=A0AAJ0GDY3_9PEZI|nr:hypothetical protein LTR09_004060 [Extremus antarcticus]
MPLLYGEGSTAFWRLQEEIIRTSTDHSIFAWHGYRVPGEVLAHSATRFKDCGDICAPCTPQPTEAYDMTNRGLRISLPMVEMTAADISSGGYIKDIYPEQWAAKLNCTQGGEALWLRLQKAHYPYFVGGGEFNEFTSVGTRITTAPENGAKAETRAITILRTDY